MSTTKTGLTVAPDRSALRAARLNALMTQQELADKADTTVMQVYRWESGKQNISMGLLRRVASALNVEDVRSLIDMDALK